MGESAEGSELPRFTVVVLAAGYGTRMRSRTPKLLHDLCGAPIIAWTVAAARDAGAEKVILVDSPQRPLAGVLDDDVIVAVQERALGTADAVRAAARYIDSGSVVAVLTGDAPLVSSETIRSVVARHVFEGAAGTVASTVLENPSGYGRVVRIPPGGPVVKIVETRRPGDATEAELLLREVNTGTMVFDSDALLAALGRVQPRNAQGELYLTDVISILRESGQVVAAYVVPNASEMLGVNNLVDLDRVRRRAQWQIHERHLRAGVTITNPGDTAIDLDVRIEPDTVIANGSNLHGSTQVGSGATVGPDTTLIDTTVGAGSSIIQSRAEGAVVGDRVTVGPFAHLRPGTVLADGVHVGGFV